MALIKSDRDRQIRQNVRIDTSGNSKAYHDLQQSSVGTTRKVNQLEKKFQLQVLPVIIDTTIFRKFG